MLDDCYETLYVCLMITVNKIFPLLPKVIYGLHTVYNTRVEYSEQQSYFN